jgi:hypothetical protein
MKALLCALCVKQANGSTQRPQRGKHAETAEKADFNQVEKD